MDNIDLYYLTGGLLAASAVIVTFIGLKLKTFPAKLAPIVALWFVILVGCATTFSVLQAKDHEKAHASAEHAASEHDEAVEHGE